jgi:hypothetical protein
MNADRHPILRSLTSCLPIDDPAMIHSYRTASDISAALSGQREVVA